jgi:flagellar motor protein MotB
MRAKASKTGNAKIEVHIRKEEVVAAGHHGGSWKVAYADFVTAMMAFFLQILHARITAAFRVAFVARVRPGCALA